MFLCDNEWKCWTFSILEIDLMENENLFPKAGVLFFSWKHEDWKRIISIQNCHTRNQCYVKTNRIVSTNWTYHKERSFASRYFFFFFNFCFSLRTSYKELTWCTNDPNVHIHAFYKCWSFIWRCFEYP